ncbi:MAG TPA: FHA domain-containing protein [Terracidiphilus sp.]|jgi:ABC-type multidrug transport system ATPase subunit/ABC-type multidrug transport system permease subunit|nr:FHA domain-containing protein [Terracidiphilus sp.]
MSPDDSKAADSWLIGNAEDCDLRVNESTVSRIHCRLSRQNGSYLLEDLQSTNGTFVDGVRLTAGQPVGVSPESHITLGTRVKMPWPSPAGSQTPHRAPTIESPLPGPGTGKGVITIGRDPASHIHIDLPIISWNHALITQENGAYILEDRNSRNGTSIGQVGNRIHRAVLDPAADVYFGSYKVAASQLLARGPKVEIASTPSHQVTFRGSIMEIGRDPNCDVPLQFPMISWRHARLTRTAEGIVVEDLGSRNGTYVNNVRIAGKILIKPGQEIGLGSFRFLLEAGGLVQREYHGNVTIEANSIVVNAPNGKRLLDSVSLTVFPSELVALMGPAGAGKTTLLKALNGYTKPVEGSVLFNGQSLYDYYDLFRQQMGYVPQDDIVHPQLTVRQALYFSARLRTDLTDGEIDQRTSRVLKDLGILDRIDTVIGSPERKTLSGGQRKRVNIALELITDTPVLFLDEPTSGLSSYDAESVVDLLKELSKSGKTIITTIHQPSLKVFKQFDDLLMVSRDKGDQPGALVYFGPAYPDSVQFFNPANGHGADTAAAPDLNPEMLFSGMNKLPEANRTNAWRKRFLDSNYQKEFVANRSGKQPGPAERTGEETPRRQFGWMQWFALVRRSIIVKLRDRAQTAILLAQAPLFAVLVTLVIYPLRPTQPDELAQKLPILHFLMVIAAVWFGCNNAARDVVGEWTIYKRERMVTLKLLPYVFSKLAVLLALCIFQCGSMLAIVYLACGLHSNFLQDFFVLLLSSMIGAGLGLCISASSKTNESAIALLPVVLLPIIALGGGMRPIFLMPRAGQVISTVIPSRWSFEANLLHEAAASEWGERRFLPDVKCTFHPDAPPAPPKSSHPAMPPPGFPVFDDPCPADSPSALCGDVVEQTIPAYILHFKNESGKDETCRATASEQYPVANPVSFATRYRHSFRVSLEVLCSMLVLLIGSVIAILRSRDRDPQ